MNRMSEDKLVRAWLTVISEPSLRSRERWRWSRESLTVYTIRSECKHCV